MKVKLYGLFYFLVVVTGFRTEAIAQDFTPPVPIADSLLRTTTFLPLTSKDKANSSLWAERNIKAVVGVYPTRMYLLQQSGRRKVTILKTIYQDQRWTEPIPLFSYRRSDWQNGAYVSSDERFIIFPQRAKGGYGKEDLYVVIRQGNQWTEPMNLGPTINSAGAEIAPCWHEETIFFASNGHPGQGHYDIFRANRQYQSWRVWTKPTNVSPLNSTDFDAYLAFSTDGNAYFRSRREGREQTFRSEIIRPNPHLRHLPRDEGLPVVKNLLRSEEGFVYFGKNSWKLYPKYRELLLYVYDKIKDHSDLAIKLVGHADREGSRSYNETISEKRALTIKNFLLSAGIEEERVEVVVQGESDPLTIDPSEEALERNRRVEIVITQRNS